MRNHQTWPFSDPPNVVAIANRKIVEGADWIAYVSHDLDDGAWQFHTADAEVAEGDAVLVSLRNIAQIDSSVLQLADLPVGWHAWLEKKDMPWRRAEMRRS
ncbi:hypothetical protein [Paraburkholderia ginsengisoli]|uniref:DUF2185 domain-containing protein n=1 Tax=Paraburkholderia ginsengisoli TaxID=311231 RepID=A0A7T4N345_9BURK|nr:hypothetical protein [Paraburkholderia ginsengisoli]QQC64329.1 hypothetical protein I6I06_02185 [Paraburkholderia ginsengisoli]